MALSVLRGSAVFPCSTPVLNPYLMASAKETRLHFETGFLYAFLAFYL